MDYLLLASFLSVHHVKKIDKKHHPIDLIEQL
ncbi:hypothetical protein YPC_2718 [Yersinia pestis biovar Medievalis str. Harbin 35]|nr:hypothetical protein YPC_2718 [Yersinia pestis biovar Medievalis str. Harbin 35]EEO81199.1 hypothetical protein YPF_1915 [Yersinia pestis biovar Orientalis str. India 195]EEO87831.1 hypothetical protein YPH_3803 [Yersinia pestis biovar Orientalis str. PEXU2]EEO90785.1 hypothetical protein YPS_2145 [Yersinia pestis Pestoides A]